MFLLVPLCGHAAWILRQKRYIWETAATYKDKAPVTKAMSPLADEAVQA